jgi:hypothetical protein
MNFCVDYEQLHAFKKKHIHRCVRDKHKKKFKILVQKMPVEIMEMKEVARSA